MTDAPEYLGSMDLAALPGGGILVTELTNAQLHVGVLDLVGDRYDWVIQESLQRDSPTARMWHKVAVTMTIDHSNVPEELHAAVLADVAPHTNAGTPDDTADAQTDTQASVDDPVAALESRMRERDLDPDDFRVWVHDDYGSLNVDTDAYLSDDEFGAWVGLKEDLDMEYDSEDDVNFIRSDDIAEVLG